MILVLASWEETGEFETIPIATRFAQDAQHIAEVIARTYPDYPTPPDYLFTFRNCDHHPVLVERYNRAKHFE